MRHGCLLAGLSLAMGVAASAQAETFSYRVGNSVKILKPMEGFAAVFTGGPVPNVPNADVRPLRTGWYSVFRSGVDAVVLADELSQNPSVKFASPYFKTASFGFQFLSPELIIRTDGKQAGGANRAVQQVVSTEPAVISLQPIGAQTLPFLSVAKLETRSFREVLELSGRFNTADGVRYAEPNRVLSAKPMFPNDPLIPQQWYVNNTGQNGGDPARWIDIRLGSAWAMSTGSNNVQVALIDDGVDLAHTDIRVGDTIDTIDGNRSGAPTAPFDTHGTPMSSLISGAINNGLGIGGVAGGARTANIKVFENGGAAILDFVEALNFVIQRGHSITVLGYSFPEGDQAITDVYDFSRNFHNVIHFSAVGPAEVGYPANEDSVLGIGSSDWVQNLGNIDDADQVFMVGPGDGLIAARRGGGFAQMGDGPSGAVAIVGGVAALMKSVNPNLNGAMIEQILASTATDMTDNTLDEPGFGFDERTGWGMVNAAQAVASAGFGSVAFPTSVIGGNGPHVGAVQLLFNPLTPFDVRLESSDHEVLTLDEPTVTMDAQSKTFEVNSVGVDAERQVRITAYIGNVARSVNVRVLPSRLDTLTVATNNAFSNDRVQATVRTVGRSGSLPRGVTVRSSNRAIVDTAQTVWVPAGQNRVSWNLVCKTVTATSQATITASLGGVSRSQTITVRVPAATLASFTLDPTSVESGLPTRGTVTLQAPATANVSITISSNNVAVVPPGPRGIALGGTTTSFFIPTLPVASNSVAIITARFGQQTKTATLTLTPSFRLEEVTVTPTSVRGGFNTTGRVRIYSPAPAGGKVITLSDNSSFATTPGSVTIPAGRTFADFTITTVPVATNKTVWLTAKQGSLSKAVSFDILR